jgi:hypothetical protein
MTRRTTAFLTAALLGLGLVACSNSGGNAGPNGCPTSAPTSGSACLLMNGTSCSYATSNGGPPAGYCGGGGGSVAVCDNGSWVYEATAGAGAGYYAACPVDAPAQGSSCAPSCGGAQQQCTYGCAQCNGSSCTATCNGSTWDVTKYSTPCSTADAGGDASAPDGETDAGPDGAATEAGGDAIVE